MALKYGLNITSSDMRNMLEQNDKTQEGVRTWRQLFGGAGLAAGAQSDALTTDYTTAISQAYKANLEQQNAVMGAGLNVGATKDMLMMSRQELAQTYDTYIRNYAKGVNTVQENYGAEVGMYDEALTERADNFSSLYNSAYTYLKDELYSANRDVSGEGETAAIYSDDKDPVITGYETENRKYLEEKGLSWMLTDDESTPGEKRLMTWEELSQHIAGPDGELTKKGIEFFDAMFNATPQQYFNDEGNKSRGFDQWLTETNPELREWLSGRDEFNYNFAGTNLGTANVLSGRESTDDKYGSYEYITADGFEDYNGISFGENSSSYKTAKSSYDSIEKARIKAENEYKKALDKWKRLDAIQQSGTPKPTKSQFMHSYYATVENAKKKWKEYGTSASDTISKLGGDLKDKLGTSLYDEFFTSNKSLYEKFEELLGKVNSTTFADEQIAKDFDKTYKQLLQKMNDYLKRNSYQRKTSGF